MGYQAASLTTQAGPVKSHQMQADVTFFDKMGHKKRLILSLAIVPLDILTHQENYL